MYYTIYFLLFYVNKTQSKIKIFNVKIKKLDHEREREEGREFCIQALSFEIFLRHILATLKSQRNQSPVNASFATSRRRRLAAAAIVGGVAVQAPGAHCTPRRRGVRCVSRTSLAAGSVSRIPGLRALCAPRRPPTTSGN